MWSRHTSSASRSRAPSSKSAAAVPIDTDRRRLESFRPAPTTVNDLHATGSHEGDLARFKTPPMSLRGTSPPIAEDCCPRQRKAGTRDHRDQVQATRRTKLTMTQITASCVLLAKTRTDSDKSSALPPRTGGLPELRSETMNEDSPKRPSPAFQPSAPSSKPRGATPVRELPRWSFRWLADSNLRRLLLLSVYSTLLLAMTAAAAVFVVTVLSSTHRSFSDRLAEVVTSWLEEPYFSLCLPASWLCRHLRPRQGYLAFSCKSWSERPTATN